MRTTISREAATVLAFSVAQAVLALVGNRVLTQVAAPAALGEYYLYMNLALWLTLPTSSSYLYLWRNWTLARATGQAPAFARAIRRGLGCQAIVCAIGCLVFWALGLTRGSWLVLITLSVVSLGQAVNTALDQVQTLERRRVLAGVLALLGGPIRQFALAAGTAFVTHQSGTSLLVTQCFYGIGASALSAILFHRTAYWPYKGDQATSNGAATLQLVSLSRFLRFSAPFLFTSVSALAATSAERWGLARRADPGATALFVQSVGVSLAAVNAVVSPLNTYMLPFVSQATAKTPHDPLRSAWRPLWQYMALTAASVTVVTIAVAILAVPVTRVLFGPTYGSIAAILPWTVLGQSLFAISQAVVMVPIAVEAASAASAAAIGSKLVYIGLLLVVPCPWDCVRWFAQCFALGNLLYFLGVVVVAARVVKARRVLKMAK